MGAAWIDFDLSGWGVASPPASGLQVTVAGVDVSAVAEVRGIQIKQVLTRRGDTAAISVVDTSLARTYQPFAPVTVTDAQGNTKFKGIVTRARQVPEGATLTRWELNCQDNTYYLQKVLTNKKYKAVGVDAIVKDLLASFPPGIAVTTNHVQTPLPSLAYFNSAHLRLADAFDKLVRNSYDTAFLMWDLDYTNDLHFFDQNNVPSSGLTITDAMPLGGGQAGYVRDTFWYERDASQFANKITFRGGTYLSNNYTQNWLGNGAQSSFPLDYPPETAAQSGGFTPTVTVAGVAQTVGLDSGTGFGANQCLISVAQASQAATLRFAAAPANGAAIAATYVYDLPVLVRRTNAASVVSFGTWEEYIVDTSVVTQAAAIKRAGAMLSQFSQPLDRAQADLDATYVGNLGAGVTVQLVSTQLGINQTMIVTDCTITGEPGGKYRHQVQLAAYG